MFLAESLQYYWPAKYGYGAHENNITLHLARSFAENGFQVWAEVPLDEKNPKLKLDFLAYNYTKEITVALELKGSIETPPDNIDDLNRLVHIHNNRLCGGWPGDFYKDHAKLAKHRIYGIATLLYAMEFANWWHDPKACDEYKPPHDKRTAEGYAQIGKSLAVASFRAVVPLSEALLSGESPDFRYRFSRAGYALYDEHSIEEVGKILANA
jgi:hypothetical protein